MANKTGGPLQFFWLPVFMLVFGITTWFLVERDYTRYYLRPLISKDAILMEGIVNTERCSPKITFGDYLEKAKKDLEIREDLILKAKSLRLSRHQKQIKLFVELLYTENQYVRAQLSMIRTELDIGDQEQRIRNLDEYLGSNLGEKIQVKSAKQRKIYLDRLKSKREELKTTAQRWLGMEMALQESMPQYRTNRNLVPAVQEKIRRLAAFD